MIIMTKTQKQSIEKHGKDLLAIFPKATERDPVELCRKLRRLEAKGAAIALRLCNGPEYPEGESDRLVDALLGKVNELLGNHAVPVFINLDPRGYALKIDDEWMREHREFSLHTDWGGYGIIAPEID
jgi:hypothetical protein